MADGYIPAWRKLFEPDHNLSMGQPVCPRFAWLDLCQMATHNERSVSYGYDVIELERGELVASVRTLAKRWRWSKSRVQRFLSMLENRDTLEAIRGTPAGTVYLVVNKDTYWLGGDGQWDSSGTPSGTGAGQERDKNKKVKKEKKGTPMAEPLWSVWLDELGGTGRRPSLNDDRRQKLQALYDEQLADEPEPAETFRTICKAVKRSDHHMSKRSYHLPESLFVNETRRERWVLDALDGPANGKHDRDPLILTPAELDAWESAA